MTLADIQNRASHTPCTKVEMDLDWCNNTFGTAPCEATGEPCYNTYPTCKDKGNFDRGVRTYKYLSNRMARRLPFPGVRPYLDQVSIDPTEIKDSLTVKAKAVIDLLDEPDGDVGLDPYVDQRSTVLVTSYWRKMLARSPNYIGRPVRIYEGAEGMAEDDYELRWKGKISTISLGRGSIRITVADLLMSLRDVEIPPKVKIKIVGGVGLADDEIIVSDTDGMTDSGYIRNGDEIVSYAAITRDQNKLTGCVRARFGTIAEANDDGSKIELIIYIPPTNPFDLLKGLLLNDPDYLTSYPDFPGAGLDAEDVDTDAFDYWRDWPGGEVDHSAIIFKSGTKLDTLFWELAGLIDCKVWYSEGQQITIRRTLPNQPGRLATVWSKDANIIDRSGSVDLNPDSRVARVVLRWDRDALADEDKAESYQAVDAAEIAESASPNSYGEVAEKEIFCRWLRRGYIQEELMDSYIRALTARRVLARRDALPLIDFEVFVKDGAVRTGAMVRLTTDELLLPTGQALDKALFEVVKRNPKGHKLAYRLLKMPGYRVAFFAPAGLPDYEDATDAQRQSGYFCGADGKMSNGDEPYTFW